MSIRDVEFDDDGSMIYGLFDGVDVRSEGLVDQFISTFKQVQPDAGSPDQRQLRRPLRSRAVRLNIWDGPLRFQTFMDAIDTDNFSVDFRGGRTTPLIGFGFDVSNPANFLYAPTPDGNQTVLGGFSLQGKPQQNITANNTFELDGTWQMTDMWKVKLGASVPRESFQQPRREPAAQHHGHARAARGHGVEQTSPRRSAVSTTCSARALPRAGPRSTSRSGTRSSTSAASRCATRSAVPRRARSSRT